MNVVAIIPARGGSKRLPRKNITPVLGKPLIGWSIEAGHASSYVGYGNVFVSTEDVEVMEVARSLGAGVIVRPAELAQDQVWTEPVIQHAVEHLENTGRQVDIVVWLNACGAEVTSDDIDRAIEKMQHENLREVFSVDGQLRSNSIVRAMYRETLFQRRLSARCGVMVLDYVDIHFPQDINEVEKRLLARASAGVAKKQISPESKA